MLSFGLLFFSLVEIMVPGAPHAVVGGDKAALEEGGAQTEPWGNAVPGARRGGAGQDAQEPPRETEAGEGGARGLPPRTAALPDAPAANPDGGPGGGSAERAGTA